MAWYASFGEQILGKFDPRTGKVTEYQIPVLKPQMPTGVLAVRFDEDDNLWMGMQFQGGVAKFDRRTETFQTWSLPPELNGDHVQINQVSPEHHKVDGKVWLQDAGTYTVLRLDVKSRKFEVFEPYPIPRPNIYDVISDTQNNVYFTVFGRENIGKIDAKTGHISIYDTPSRGSAPRRGMIDSAGRFWFGENRADRIGMFDPRTEHFQEWPAPKEKAVKQLPTIYLSAVLAASALVAASWGGAPPPPAASAPAAQPAPTPEGTEGILYVTNERGGDLSVVDVATKKVLATIALGKRPRGSALSPDGALLYVALSGSPIAGPGVDESTLPPPDKRADGIGVVDLKARKFLRLMPGGSDPDRVAVSADGKWLYVANEDVGQASVVNAENGDVVATVKVGGEPEGVNVSPDGKMVYVTSEEDSAVFVIDAIKPRLVRKVEVGPRPRSTTFLPDGSRAYVPSETGGEVRVIDTKTYKTLATIKLKGEVQRPMSGVASPDGKLVYMSLGRGKGIAIIDTATNEHVGSFEVGDRPWGIAMTPDGKMIFTANGPSNDVSFFDTD